METKTMKLADIRPAPYNPRVELTPEDQERKALAASIEENGLVLPLIVNARDNTLIGGHQRLNVLLDAGENETTVVVVDLDGARAKALCIALNRIDGEWDYGKLSDVLQELTDSGEDILSTGFTSQEMSELLGEIEQEIEPDNGEDADGEEPAQKYRCCVGEYEWQMTGDEYEALLADIHCKAGFARVAVLAEIKRRVLREV